MELNFKELYSIVYNEYSVSEGWNTANDKNCSYANKFLGR